MIQTLVITGANNHDWRRTAPFCKALLEGTGKFAVHLTADPAEFFADTGALGQYQLFFLDYNGPDWGDAAKRTSRPRWRAEPGCACSMPPTT